MQEILKPGRTGNMNEELYVQYGCGCCAPPQWRNFDASPTLRFERMPLIGWLYTKNSVRFPANVEYGDIVRGLPIPKETCRAVYCSHVLEHLALEDCRKALRNTYHILKPGGTFRLVVPDLEPALKKYLTSSSPDAAIQLLKESSLGREKRSRGLKSFLLEWLGNSQHLWMWDFKSLAHELQQAGFKDIRRAQFGDSPDLLFQLVEDKARWEGCLGLECKK